MTATNFPDLLPDTLEGPAQPEPLLDLRHLLEHQARLFVDRTGGAIRPVVETRPGYTAGRLAYDFVLVVPALGDYRYTLFTLEVGFEAPPVWLHTRDGQVELTTEERIHEALRELFAAPATLRVLQSLLVLAREEGAALDR